MFVRHIEIPLLNMHKHVVLRTPGMRLGAVSNQGFAKIPYTHIYVIIQHYSSSTVYMCLLCDHLIPLNQLGAILEMFSQHDFCFSGIRGV